MEAVRLIAEKGYSIAEASRNLGVEYSVLRRWKKLPSEDSQNAFPAKGELKADDEQLRRLEGEPDRVKEERDILRKPWPNLPRIRNEIAIHVRPLGDIEDTLHGIFYRKE